MWATHLSGPKSDQTPRFHLSGPAHLSDLPLYLLENHMFRFYQIYMTAKYLRSHSYAFDADCITNKAHLHLMRPVYAERIVS